MSDGQAAAEVEPYPFYLSAWEEDKHTIGQANILLDKQGKIVNERVNSRHAGEFKLAPREAIEYMDVSPKQLVSVAASLIPFLENDDANRALMGSNMQRQAVPLLRARLRYVGTGMEKIAAQDSGAVVVASRDGVVDFVDSERIIVKADRAGRRRRYRARSTADIYSARQVQTFEPEHLYQPAADRPERSSGSRRARSSPTGRVRIAASLRSGTKRARGVHAVARL